MDAYGSDDYDSRKFEVESTMMPALIYRCPDCGHTGLSRRFTVVGDDDGRTRVECPACHHRFERIDDPWLK